MVGFSVKCHNSVAGVCEPNKVSSNTRSIRPHTGRYILHLFVLTILPALFISIVGPQLSNLVAEEVRVGRGSLKVERLRVVDQSTVQVTLFGETTIVSNDDLGFFVLRSYHRGGKQIDLTDETLASLVLQGNDISRSNLALLSAAILAGRPSFNENDWAQLVTDLEKRPASLPFIRQLLAEPWILALDRQALARLLIAAAAENPSWARLEAPALLVLVRDQLISIMSERFSRIYLDQGIDGSSRYLNDVDEFLGRDSETSRGLRRINQELNQVSQGFGVDGLELLVNLLESSTDQRVILSVVPPILLEVAHRRAASALENQNAGEALMSLSFVPLERRTPTTHQLISSALAALPPSRTSILGYRPVALMLRAVAGKDKEIEVSYTGALDRQLRAIIEAPSIVLSEFDFYLRQLVLVRPDPDRANDQLRIAFAVRLLNAGRHTEAQALLADSQTGVPLLAKIRMWWGALSADLYALLLVALGIIILGLAIRLRAHREPDRETDNSITNEQKLGGFAGVVEDEDEEIDGGFSLLRQRQMLNPTYLEYERCLRVLGVDPKSTLREIKTHYRTRIKDVHPDVQDYSVTEGGADEFMEVTRAYDRALELRRTLGLPDDA